MIKVRNFKPHDSGFTNSNLDTNRISGDTSLKENLHFSV